MNNLTGEFTPTNPEKYMGKNKIIWRSTWELHFMRVCDAHPNIVSWASEPLKIPYLNPLTGNATVYVPDFIIEYVDANGARHRELIEIKPACQTYAKLAKKKRDQMALVVNASKWKAAQNFASKHSMKFRVITEEDIFHNYKK